jgi:glucosamine 6-phosphate synthetase-like amidotransferase/phosphosugar isomerase protein
MCGLVGIVGNNLSQAHFEAFKWLLLMDTTRGEDSTGVAYRKVSTNNKRSQLAILKVEGLPSNLYRKFPEVFTEKGVFKPTNAAKENITWLMGHNRAATIGQVNSLNAHPFHHGHITGCHNGTVRTGLTLLEKGPEVKGTTDSEQIFYTMSKGVSLDTIVKRITGGTALTWWDSKELSYNIYRNKERPMHYAYDATTKIFVYASEQWMLRLALSQAKLSFLVKDIKELEEDSHLKIQFEGLGIKDVTIKTVKPLAVVSNNQVNSNYSAMYPKGNQLLNRSVKVPEYLNSKGKSETSFRSSAGWLDMSKLTKEDFDKNTRFGCALCQTNLDYNEFKLGDVLWLEKDTPLCSSCAADFHVA